MINKLICLSLAGWLFYFSQTFLYNEHERKRMIGWLCRQCILYVFKYESDLLYKHQAEDDNYELKQM